MCRESQFDSIPRIEHVKESAKGAKPFSGNLSRLISIHELLLRNLHNDTSFPFFFRPLCEFIYTASHDVGKPFRSPFWGPLYGLNSMEPENYYEAVKVNWNDPQNISRSEPQELIMSRLAPPARLTFRFCHVAKPKKCQPDFSSSSFKGLALIILNRISIAD